MSTYIAINSGANEKTPTCSRKRKIAIIGFLLFIIIIVTIVSIVVMIDSNNNGSNIISTTVLPTITPTESPTLMPTESPTKSPTSFTLPKIVTTSHISLNNVHQISRYRSSFGSSYTLPSTYNETCRSMLHYFVAFNTSFNIYSPLNGTIWRLEPEQYQPNDIISYQIGIQSDVNPLWIVTIYFVDISNSGFNLSIGTQVNEGEIIGQHVGNLSTNAVAALYLSSINSYLSLHSLFNIMTDKLFESYADYGIENRGQLIISKDVRDNYPLKCKNNTLINPYINITNGSLAHLLADFVSLNQTDSTIKS
eukprot:324086_1